MTSNPAVLAGPPGDCCFSKGVKHSGTPVGRTETIGGVQTYVSEPSQSQSNNAGTAKNVILFMSDIWGPFKENAQLLQDYFAENGFYVVGLDYFFGDTVDKHDDEPNFDRMTWVKEKKVIADEAAVKWFKAVKEIYGSNAKYCAVGYCFGAPYVLEWATTDEIVAGAFAHPALLNEDHFSKIKKPLFMSCAETDPTFPLPARRRAEDLLIEAKAQYCIHVFSGVAHGFATRGDPNQNDSRWAKEESASSIGRWFQRFTRESK
ncbi:alpha/beta-hydrolase [Dendrothele bispora CBS 962.96]|uniref:Alpha/beta-hydrolase n=1 Tax=Dendrothele bispora (strain CBS 962.96) TaxID=1314807 RepID=A0A4S8LM74_DENBC|nr:alpha/beta-hydrolase [Dendrothele bispora CBS 962.96]